MARNAFILLVAVAAVLALARTAQSRNQAQAELDLEAAAREARETEIAALRAEHEEALRRERARIAELESRLAVATAQSEADIKSARAEAEARIAALEAQIHQLQGVDRGLAVQKPQLEDKVIDGSDFESTEFICGEFEVVNDGRQILEPLSGALPPLAQGDHYVDPVAREMLVKLREIQNRLEEIQTHKKVSCKMIEPLAVECPPLLPPMEGDLPPMNQGTSYVAPPEPSVEPAQPDAAWVKSAERFMSRKLVEVR